jgi:signal transduction histidine kinase
VAASTLTDRLSSIAGLGTWLVNGIPAVLSAVGDPGLLASPSWQVWWGAYLVFGVAFWAISSGRLDRLSLTAHRALLGVQTLLVAAAMAAQPGYGITAILLIITASHAAHVWSLRAGTVWVVVQSVPLAAASYAAYGDVANAAIQTLAYVGFQVFALVTTHTAIREGRSRRELARLNAELEATQRLLEESSRAQERLRISRELHDLLGHHLTALILNLDVASRVTTGKGQEPLQKAHAVAKLLMADVRSAVSRLREDDELHLSAALTALAANIPRPTVHLDVQPDLAVTDVRHAQVVVRCVQEAITNAIKHADARNLWIAVAREGDEIAVHAHDDGHGARDLQVGHGLAGMRERLEAVGGRLQVRTSPGAGFTLDAWLPTGGPA